MKQRGYWHGKLQAVTLRAGGKTDSKGSSAGLRLHQDKGAGKEMVGMESGRLDFGQVWPMGRKYP